jgi:hypothetical protein
MFNNILHGKRFKHMMLEKYEKYEKYASVIWFSGI